MFSRVKHHATTDQPRLPNEPGSTRDCARHHYVDGSDPRVIGNPDAFDSEARLSPNGGAVVFGRWDASSKSHAFMIRDLGLIQTVPANDPAAKPQTLYEDAEHTGFKPAYSTDGSRIVFGCDGNLCLMTADGSKVVTLVGPVGFELNHVAWGVSAP